jgi:hypothetical protein
MPPGLFGSTTIGWRNVHLPVIQPVFAFHAGRAPFFAALGLGPLQLGCFDFERRLDFFEVRLQN